MANNGRGLRGLPGLNNISEEERQQFMLANEERLRKYRNPAQKKKAAEILYNNMQFKNTFGEDSIAQAKASGMDYTTRNNMLKEKVVGDAFTDTYMPREGHAGAGDEWSKLQELSTDAKQKLLESDWKTPEEMKKHNDEETWYGKGINFLKDNLGVVGKVVGTVVGLPNDLYTEARNQYRKDSNQKILDRIYNDDADGAASTHAQEVAQAYGNYDITGRTDEETKQKFIREITPGSYKGNLGISEYASHYGDGTDISEELENLSVDDMRKVLAKKYVYERTMSPQMAMTALNNEAKRYIKDNQGSWRRFTLFGKDVGISAMSYTADKVNSIYNLALAAQDKYEDAYGGKPEVFMDEQGNILDPNKVRVVQDRQGNLFYNDDEGNRHPVHRQQMDRTVLHNMGKEADGSDSDEGVFTLNPQYWTRAEQFGTLDADEQKQYEKLGSSPYKVAYDPNDDADLVYESFKMMSFGLADAASMLIPFGIGTAGKVLSTAGKVGKVGRGFGKALETAGRLTSAQSRVGQVAQGLAGAGGIAYAYQRGAFQETLAKNLADAEEANLNKSRTEVFNQYNNDEQYKARIDALTLDRAAQMKCEYLAQAQREGQQIADEAALDEMLVARAKDAVLAEAVENQVQHNKGTQEYADLQNRAYKEAGDAAITTFLPEAIKYGLVNTLGFRKFLYTNPQGVAKKVSRSLKGLKETTTAGGKQRLVVETAQSSPWYVPKKAEGVWNSNVGKLARVAGSQFWGGAWTNGTDDMMVDAAERINEDSYGRYLKQYENGEALADEYGLIDGLYSYWKGLGNSLGQGTTWDAATVGGFGSIVSASPNMVNIAHLATKEGRQSFKDNYTRRNVYETDANGYKTVKKGEDGKIVTEDIPLSENWGERLGYFIQNGVLNTYYGNKQSERDLQNHADYVNAILDEYEDFDALKDLIASDVASQNIVSLGDEKTGRFIKAFQAINALNTLGKSKNDPATMSSVVDNAKALIENASKIGTDGNQLSDEQMQALVSEYYANNPDLTQSEENNQVALANIAKNAQKMMEAYKAFQEADKHLRNYEKDKGITLARPVRDRMLMNKALDGHWRDRLQMMQDEIGDTSNGSTMTTGETLIAAMGGKKKAEGIAKSYDAAEKLKQKQLSDTTSTVQDALDKYNEAQQELRDADTSEKRYAAEQKVKETRVAYENAVEGRQVVEDEIENLKEHKTRLQEALDAWEKGTKNKVLTADEIMALDPYTRAAMMNPAVRNLYNARQRREIEKLEGQLKEKDSNGDPLAKIQDIPQLMRNLAKNEDAYNRLSRNPDAAALQFEQMRKEEAEKAYKLINERNARILADTVEQIEAGLKFRKDVGKQEREQVAYQLLRNYNPTLLDTIKEQEMLPQFTRQIDDAKDWGRAMADIDAVVNAEGTFGDRAKQVGENVHRVIERAMNRDEIVSALEKVVDDTMSDGTTASQDMEKVLEGLQNLGYHRDATVIENRKQRREREEAARKKAEELRIKAEEEAKVAAEQAAAEKAAREAEAAAAASEGEHIIGTPGSVTETGEREDIAGFEDIAGPKKDEAPKAEGQKITTTVTTRSGKSVTGEYDVNKDQDGFTHIKRGYGPAVAQRRISPADMESIGISEDDVLGKREDYNTPENYDALKKVYSEEGFKIEDVTIRPDGTVAVNHNEDYFELKGEKAQKFLDKVFPELSQKEEGEKPAAGWGSVASSLMEEGAEPGSVELGNIWSGDVDKAVNKPLVATLGKEAGNPVITFSSDGKPETLTIGKGDWVFEKEDANTTLLKESEMPENKSQEIPFNVKSIAKIDGEWVFKGNFAGQNTSRMLRMSDTFNLDDAVSKERTQRETAYLSQGVEANDRVIESTDGDATVTAVESPSFDQQKDADTSGVVSVDTIDDSFEEEMDKHDKKDKETATSLSANAMSRYVYEARDEKGALTHTGEDLREGHKAIRKRGRRDGDPMNNYFDWMAAEGINLQGIIDEEMPQILRKKSNLQIRFGGVLPRQNATKDSTMFKHLMLFIDYDGAVEAIHKKYNNGGVIEHEGKKYLIVGVEGYTPGNRAQQAWKDILFNAAPSRSKGETSGIIPPLRKQYMDDPAHSAERYYIHPTLYTEVEPGSLTPGFVVRQAENDASPQIRSILDLLNTPDRNPHGLTLGNLGWVLQLKDNVLKVNTRGMDSLSLKNQEANEGNVFFLIPAGHKWLPAYVQPRRMHELRDGALKQRVDSLVEALLTPDEPGRSNYNTRLAAIKELSKILYLNKDGKMIWLDKKQPVISFKNAGKEVWKVNLNDPNFTTADFWKAAETIGFRINVTADVLADPNKIKEYAEAGVFDTDCARLGAVGLNYRIYPVQADGTIVKPANASAPVRRKSDDAEFDKTYTQVHYKGKVYRESGGIYTLDGGEVITDTDLIQQLQYAQRIVEEGAVPIREEGNWKYYSMVEGDKPVIVRQLEGTNAVKVLSAMEAQQIQDKIKEEKAESQRAENAQRMIEEAQRQQAVQLDNIDLGDTIPSTGSFEATHTEDLDLGLGDGQVAQEGQKDREEDTHAEQQRDEVKPAAPVRVAPPTSEKSDAKSLAEWMKDRPVKKKVARRLFTKWAEIPTTDIDAMMQFLQEKGVPDVNAIADIDVWLDTVENCY